VAGNGRDLLLKACGHGIRMALARVTRDPERPLTVSALSRRITLTLEDLGPLVVHGELSQVKIHPSGHLYATLRDREAVVSLVMWRSQLVRNGPLPQEGEQVAVRGSLTVYAPRGQYQLQATKIAPIGAGDLNARFEALKAKLDAEGLFAEDQKRPLPFLPRAVGLATAAGSAALADLLHSLRERFPTMAVVLAPCQVQGAGAPASIVAAIQALSAHADVDVIVVGRGGGSKEDLAAFNDEGVVRAIAACPVPVVSAVGHETDTSLADLVADVRAKTPTAAGEMVVPPLAELRAHLQAGRSDLDRAMDGLVDEAAARLRALAMHRALSHPRHRVEILQRRADEYGAALDQAMTAVADNAAARLDRLSARLHARAPLLALAASEARCDAGAQRLRVAMERRIDEAGARLATGAGRLHALSPLAVVARGYSVLRTARGDLIRSLAQSPPGTAISARVSDGWLHATVNTTESAQLPGTPPGRTPS
jgi:exodeoxyribonuclease VII large subunit